MPFDADEIERMRPAVRVEIQDRIARLDGKVRDFKASGRAERRQPAAAPPAPWPRLVPWGTARGRTTSRSVKRI